MNPPDYPIHPIAKLFPPLSPDDLAEMEADIAAHGVREPIKLWRGQILDGVNRYEIARKLGVPYPTVELDPSVSPWDVVKSSNVVRRHMTAKQRAALFLRAEEMLPELRRAREDAQRRQRAGTSASDEARGKTADVIADAVGVSTATVERVQRAAKADPASLDRIIGGETTSSQVVKATPKPTAPTKATDTDTDTKRHRWNARVRTEAATARDHVNSALASLTRLVKIAPPRVRRRHFRADDLRPDTRSVIQALRTQSAALAAMQRRVFGRTK